MGHLPGQQFRYAGRREGLCHPSGTRSRSWYSERCQRKTVPAWTILSKKSAITGKIINPWEGMEGYFCFGGAPNNESGLKMEFYEDGDQIVSKWVPEARFQGWLRTLHGGYQATLLDGRPRPAIARASTRVGVTSRMENSVPETHSNTTDSHLTLKGRIKEQKRNFVFIEAEIYNAQDEVCTKAVCTYFICQEKKQKRKCTSRGCYTEKEKESLRNLTAKASFF